MQKSYSIPLEFVSFAILPDAKMYKHHKNDGVFVLESRRRWGNSVVYGAVFHLYDDAYHYQTLDAYHLCSMSTLGRNHQYDTNHRVKRIVRPILFDTVDELERLLYRERPELNVTCYVGNENHPNIKQRLNKTNSYRIIDGVVPVHFLDLLREEEKWS